MEGDSKSECINGELCVEEDANDTAEKTARYDVAITISKKDVDFYNELMGMEGCAIYKKYGLKRDERPCALTASFSNGYQMDIDLIICKEDSPYLNIVLFNANGVEVNCETGEGRIDDEYCLSDDTGDYFVNVIAK